MDICGIWKIKEISVPTPEGVKTYSRDNMPEGEMYEDFKQMIDSLTEFVADGTLNTLALPDSGVLVGQLIGMAEEIVIEGFDHGLGLRLLILGDGGEVDGIEHKLMEPFEGVPDLAGQGDFRRAVLHDVGDEGSDPLALSLSEHCTDAGGNLLLAERTGTFGVLDIMANVGEDVGEADKPPLGGFGERAGSMPDDAVADLGGKVQPLSVALDDVDDAEGLLVMVEAVGTDFPQDGLAGMAEGGMAEVMPEGDGLG